MAAEVATTRWGLYGLRTGHWSDRAVITVSKAPKMDPSAKVINIRKKSTAQN